MKNFNLQTAKRLATLLDNKFEFLGIRFGLDPILDFILGLIPIVGNIGTIFFRSNILNIKIIEDYLGSRTVEEGVIVG